MKLKTFNELINEGKNIDLGHPGDGLSLAYDKKSGDGTLEHRGKHGQLLDSIQLDKYALRDLADAIESATKGQKYM